MKKILIVSTIAISLLSADKNITIVDSATKIVDDIGEKSNNIIKSIKDKTINLLEDNNSSKEINVVELYTKCKGCHGSDGKIKALNKSPIIASQNIDDLISKLKGYRGGELDNYGMGRLMTTQTEDLTTPEIEALAKYISKL